MKSRVETFAQEHNMTMMDAARTMIVVNLSPLGVSEDEMVAIAERAAGISDHDTVADIAHEVTGRPVVVYFKRGQNWVKIIRRGGSIRADHSYLVGQ